MCFLVPKSEEGKRLDAFVASVCPDLSRSYVQKLVEDGCILVNGIVKKASYKVTEGEKISVELPEPKPLEVVPKDLDLKVLYEDADLAVVFKPRGLVVHPAAGHEDDTFVNGLVHEFGDELSSINGVNRPGIVHRIDKDTSGVLAVCKSDRAHRGLSELFEKHDIEREYRGIVFGDMELNAGTVAASVGRSQKVRTKMAVRTDGKPAITHYKVLERFGAFTYVSFQLETGRTHQIRVHMQSIGHPLLGDSLYTPVNKTNTQNEFIKKLKALDANLLEGQILHARLLGFIHPVTGQKVCCVEEEPPYFQTVLQKLREEYGQ